MGDDGSILTLQAAVCSDARDGETGAASCFSSTLSTFSSEGDSPCLGDLLWMLSKACLGVSVVIVLRVFLAGVGLEAGLGNLEDKVGEVAPMTMRVERRGVLTNSASGDGDGDEVVGRTSWTAVVVHRGDTVGVRASTAQSVS